MYRQNLICFFFKTEIGSYYACMTGEPGGLLSLGLHRVGHDWSDLAAAAACMYYPEIDFCHLLMYQRHSLGICLYYILFIYFFLLTYCAQLLQLCLIPILCDPMDCRPPGFSVHGIFLVIILDWFAMFSSKGSSWPRDQSHISCISCTAGGFFTTEPLGKPCFMYIFI